MASTVLPNGIIIPEKFSRDWYADLYHNWQELDNLLGGGTPKDGTLTIQKNGDTVGTFSANQATNETVNIEVPTKTSDLNNDSGFITGVAWDDVTNKPSFATVATSGSYNDLSDTPTIPTVNDATLTIQKNGTDVATFSANSSTNATANITVPTKTSDLTNDSGFITSDNTKIPLAGSNQISGSLIPSTDGTVNLGGSSYQWNNAYIKSLTINGVVCGDILTHNASEFVDVSSNQTIGGVKTFSDGINNKNEQQFIFNKEYSDATDTWLGIHNYSDKNSTRVGFYAIGDFSGNRGFRWFVRGQLTNSVETDIFGFGRKINETSYMYINATLETDLIPTVNNSKSLGTSTNKWKSINGINPGALSLPGTNFISLDTTSWDMTGTSFNYTPTIDAWMMINVSPSNNIAYVSAEYDTMRFNSESTTGRNAMITIPVLANKQVGIVIVGASIVQARLIPCQGNV